MFEIFGVLGDFWSLWTFWELLDIFGVFGDFWSFWILLEFVETFVVCSYCPVLLWAHMETRGQSVAVITVNEVITAYRQRVR